MKSKTKISQTAQTTSQPVSAASLAALLVGKAKNTALDLIKKAGFRGRITKEDGQAFVVTRDARGDRINLVVSNGIVDSATVG